jgi:DNA mismatch endonuclease, patch repair protein
MTPEARSALMARIRSTNTAPELVVRRLAHGMGFRFRLHQRRLAGKPDLVFPGRKCIVLVHGCFWHRHGCSLSSRPKINSAYWEEKIRTNVSRDSRNLLLLQESGWRVMVIWECETRQRDLTHVAAELRAFLVPTSETAAVR